MQSEATPHRAELERAIAAHRAGDLRGAEALYRDLLSRDPHDFDALHMLGVLCGQTGRLSEAERLLLAARAIDGAAPPLHIALGLILAKQNRLDEAIDSIERAAAIDKASVRTGAANVYVARAIARSRQSRFSDALADATRACEIAPDRPGGWHERGNALNFLNRFSEALDCYDRALAIDPSLAIAWGNRSDPLLQLGRTAEALASVDRAAFLQPDNALILSKRIFKLDFAASDFEAQQAARKQWWQAIGEPIAVAARADYDNDRDPNRRLILGYVSADFRDHSAAICFGPVLLNHDQSQFEIVCYSCASIEDDTTGTFRGIANRWRDATSFSDDALAAQIRADRVDILIDLSGHSAGNRLGVFARKPAPVQVTAWGHATGTGLRTIDYLFSDPVAIPREIRHVFAETIYDLPCLTSIDPLPAGLDPGDLPALANGSITFGVFNRVTKVSDAALDAWADILGRAESARILFKHGAFDDEGARARVGQKLGARGVKPERIAFLGTTSRRDHLAAYRLIDIALDPFPHGGGVSTWEALQMGVPVVALLGNSVPSRLAAAIVSSIGLDDWIARTPGDYAALALQRAGDAPALAALRRELPARIAASDAGNAARYTRAVERAYRAMWQRYCARSIGAAP